MPEAGERMTVPAPPPAWLLRLAAGVEAAVPSAIAVLVWFAIHARLSHEPWWSKFNVAAAPWFGDRVYYMGFGRASAAGAATLFVVYCILGILYAFLAGRRSAWRAALTSFLWLAAWHFFAQQSFWPKLDPFAAPYFSHSATAPAHMAAAILLARFPRVHRRLRSLLLPPASAQAAGSSPPEAPGADAGGRLEAQPPPAATGEPPPFGPDC
jgi:hypothetical protein